MDVGQGGEDLDVIRDRALACGAADAEVVDAREEFAAGYCLPALQANALYMNRYPLVSALSRPLIVTHLARVARERGADAVAHGCTGKGNDQVRFEVGLASLAPEVKVLAPVRDSGMTRDKAIAFAEEKGLPIDVTSRSPYSIDQNLWGRSCETGHLEDIWEAPHDDVWSYTEDPAVPRDPDELVISFADGVPVAIDGQAAAAAGHHHRAERPRRGAGGRPGGHGRGPAGRDQEPGDLRGAGRHRADRRALRARERVHGAGPGPVQAVGGAAVDRAGLRRAVVLAAQDARSTRSWREASRHVTGDVRLRLHGGQAVVTGRRSPVSLYDYGLATYDTGDTFDQALAKGFVELWGLPSQDRRDAGPPGGGSRLTPVRSSRRAAAVPAGPGRCGHGARTTIGSPS